MDIVGIRLWPSAGPEVAESEPAKGGAGFGEWVAHFNRNRDVHALVDPTIPFDSACDLASSDREPLIRSVQRFQLGESGDGQQLLRKAQAAHDPDYLTAATLFVAEEQEHAALLLRLLTYLGALPIPRHWTDTVFVRLRRILGLKTELMVLTVAEVIALHYYGMLARGGPDPVVAAVAGRIVADERDHVRFHQERLRIGFADASSPGRIVCQVLWTLTTVGTALVVAIDHAALLRACQYRRRRFVADVMATFFGVQAGVMGRGGTPQ